MKPVFAALLLAAGCATAAPRDYAIDPVHTRIVFSIGHAGFSRVQATLSAPQGRLRFDPGTNVIEVHISRLRAKLDRDFPRPLLLTEKGRGYRLAC